MRKHCSRCKQHEMAEHKADTYNMFKSLVNNFPEYNEILISEELPQINSRKSNSSKSHEKIN